MATAPATPTTTRTRDREDGGSGLPVRAQPARRTITYDLPSDFDLGAINVAATQRTVGQITGVDGPPSCFPPEVIVKFQKKYSGGCTNLGSAVLQL